MTITYNIVKALRYYLALIIDTNKFSFAKKVILGLESTCWDGYGA